MPTYQREVRVNAPLDDVWEFHSRIGGLKALTPDWMHLRVEEVRGPEGDDADDRDDPDVLDAGTEIRLSVRPFGVGPRQRWVTRIVRREREAGSAVFEDVMEDGPFRTWRHVHQFYAVSDGEARCVSNASSEGQSPSDHASGQRPRADGERSDPRAAETLVRDRVEYELPLFGSLFGPMGWVGFEPMFRERHRRTKRILEGDGSRAEHQGSE